VLLKDRRGDFALALCSHDVEVDPTAIVMRNVNRAGEIA
jgi:hypothetical protein